jgi:hypothetical protein
VNKSQGRKTNNGDDREARIRPTERQSVRGEHGRKEERPGQRRRNESRAALTHRCSLSRELPKRPARSGQLRDSSPSCEHLGQPRRQQLFPSRSATFHANNSVHPTGTGIGWLPAVQGPRGGGDLRQRGSHRHRAHDGRRPAQRIARAYNRCRHVGGKGSRRCDRVRWSRT